MNELPEEFDHATREPEIYKRWEEAGAFRANRDPRKKPFYLPMPPPNATGPLHLGHALTLTIEDILARWRRMAGDDVLWLPGTDHASIAAESIVLRQLEEREGGKDPREKLDREALRTTIANHVEEMRKVIRAQIEAMGSSCDWSRERYTLDEGMQHIVAKTFGRMFRDGLIYRGDRIVNWDVDLGTTLADDEVQVVENPEGRLYVILCGPLKVATHRPELMLANTALAVHPEDQRYRKLIGREIKVPWPRRAPMRLRVIADSTVDSAFGEGVVGIAPAHDPADFEIAKRYRLPLVRVINEKGRMTEATGPYAGMTIAQCREALVSDLRHANQLESAEPHAHRLRRSHRGGAVVYLLRQQWFIDVNRPAVNWAGRTLSLRQVLTEVVYTNKIHFTPEYQEKNYFHWVDKLRDWCISRQISWGHRVPVWYRGDSEMYIGACRPEGPDWVQDDDTLDTWFSSALWSWATLIDPETSQDPALSLSELLDQSEDYRYFHPATLLETGYDILFFWVARMILMTAYTTQTIPFKTVHLHGLLRDRERRRMSSAKHDPSLDPRQTIAESGADALRLALVSGANTGFDMQWSPHNVVGAATFITKLWNAGRYVAVRTRGAEALPRHQVKDPINGWMLDELDQLISKVVKALERYSFVEASKSLCLSFRKKFCDQYIEATKAPFFRDNPETSRVLRQAFETYLVLLHPIIPFVTEELWTLAEHEDLLMKHRWPVPEPSDHGGGSSDAVAKLFMLAKRIRQWRLTQGLWGMTPIAVRLWVKRDREMFERCTSVFLHLINASSVELTTDRIEGDINFDDETVVAIVPAGERLK